MNNIITKVLKTALLSAILSGSAFAEHDNGQGKSQDGKHQLDSVSVAPEPSTFWLFLSGTLAIAAVYRYKNGGVRVKCQSRHGEG